MDVKSTILNRLLDTYEAGKHFTSEQKINRRVAMKFDINFYDIENAALKSEIHYVVDRLCEKEIITFTWLKQQKGNIIDKAYLNLDQVDAAYTEIGRKPKSKDLVEIMYSLQKLKEGCSINWINSFIDYSIEEVEEKKKYPRYIPKDEQQRKLFFIALEGIKDKGSEEMLERIFSRKYLGNSKAFENKIRNKVTSVIKEFLFGGKDIEEKDCLQEALLQEIGIIKSSEDLLFCGNLTITLASRTIEYGKLIYGASMNTTTINQFDVEKIGFKKIITIENKACYYAYIAKQREDELVVYLGGFYSPVKRKFLMKVYDYCIGNSCEVTFMHWGDIDYGGFCIFRLLNKIIKELRPVYMDTETLMQHLKYCDPFDADYAAKLKGLLNYNDFAMFSEVIINMLNHSVKLEQEAYYALQG